MTTQDFKNEWRLLSPSDDRWDGLLSPGSPDKAFVVTCDSHVNEPADYLDRVPEEFKHRLPHMVFDDDGVQWMIAEGWTPQLIRVPPERTDLLPELEVFEDYEELQPYTDRMEPEDVLRAASGRSVEGRRRDRESQGVDAEVIFPQKGQLCFATPDPAFQMVMCQAYNRWVIDYFSSDAPASMPMALVPPGVIETAIEEIQWAADAGFKGIMLPNRPIYHRQDQPRFPREYNDKSFEPLWSAIAETGLPIILHVSSGQDPRAVSGPGAAITNYVCHSMETTIEPVVAMISSGVFERHPALRLATAESGVGHLPWLLQTMDHSYRAHHMWVRPVIPDLPSEYFRRHCFASFNEEPGGVKACIELGLEDNLLWSNDYPHAEGAFPHGRQHMERHINSLTETQARKVLGLNAARLFGLEPNVPTADAGADA